MILIQHYVFSLQETEKSDREKNTPYLYTIPYLCMEKVTFYYFKLFIRIFTKKNFLLKEKFVNTIVSTLSCFKLCINSVSPVSEKV